MLMMASYDDFRDFMGPAKPNTMDLTPYAGHRWDCACGKTHPYTLMVKNPIQGIWKVVMQCPDNSTYLTCVKVKMKMWVKFEGFESLFGLKLSQEEAKTVEILMVLEDYRANQGHESVQDYLRRITGK